MTRTMRILTTLLLAGMLAVPACAPASDGDGTGSPPPASDEATAPGTDAGTPDDGAALVAERCTLCHNTDRIQQAEKTPAEWEATVDRMIKNGAQLNDEERQTVIDYLSSR